MKKLLAAAAVALMATSIVSGSMAAAPKDTTIKIGAVLPMSGAIATFGSSTSNGIQLAFDDLNANDKFFKKNPLKMYLEDSKGETAESANAVNKLIASEKVMAIIGDVASSCTLASAPIAQSSGIPMISSTSTNIKVTQVGNLIFRACFIDDFQGEVMAKFALGALKDLRDKPGGKLDKKIQATPFKVAIFTAISSDYSKGLATAFKASFTKGKGTIVDEESYQEGDQDFSAQLTKIKAGNPDAIYVPGYYSDVALIARQEKQLSLNVPLLGGDGYDSPKLYELGGDSIVGSYFSNHYHISSGEKVAKDFRAAYNLKYHVEPDALAALGYDAAKIMAAAIEKIPAKGIYDTVGKKKVKVSQGEAIRRMLVKTDYQGVTGSVKFDENRNPVKSAMVLRVESGNGQYSFVTMVKP